MDSENSTEVPGEDNPLQRLQDEADAVATRQLDLQDQLKTAEQSAHELQQKITEELRDVGGEA